jgi:hypothetical protein
MLKPYAVSRVKKERIKELYLAQETCETRYLWVDSLPISSSHVAGFPRVQSRCNIHGVKFLEEQLGRVWNVHL